MPGGVAWRAAGRARGARRRRGQRVDTPLPSGSQAVALCQVPLATLPGSLGSMPILPLCSNQAPLPTAWLSQAAGAAVSVSTRPPRATSWSFGSQPGGAREVCQASRHACCGRAPIPVYQLALSAPGSGAGYVFAAAGARAVTLGR